MAQQPPEDAPPEEPKARHSAAYWHAQLDAAAKREDSWRKQGCEVQARYLDDRKGYEGGDVYERRINILWANTELQKGSLFAHLGNPDVRRAFPKPGRDNKIARTAALVLERALVACGNRYDPECQIEDAVEDHLLPGRGVCWQEYEASVEEYTETNELTGAQTTAERVAYQDVRFCHVEWKDFRHGPGKSWERDVPWVARRIPFTKDDVKAQWPDLADKVPCDFVADGEKTAKKGQEEGDSRRALIWEIWYKPKRIRVYVAENCDIELSREEDPYRLESFFPCPKPLYGVRTASTLTPKPEFLLYKDQADELDRVNTRIWKLLEKLRYCGVYDGSGEDGDALEGIGDLNDGEFKPYKNFRALAEGGGLAAAFQVRDLAPIAAAIQSLAQRALELIQAIYEVTGLSDVMRGSTDPSETLGAQDLKARFGSQRMQRKQKDVHRFVRDLYKQKAELIAEHFERGQLEEMTGIRLPLAAERDQAKAMVKASEQAKAAAQQMQQQGQEQGPQPQPQPGAMPGMAPQPQMPPQDPLAGMAPEDAAEVREIADSCSWEEISGILRSDDRRNYKIEVETDSINYQETEEEKKQRLEFVNIMVGLIAQVGTAAQGNPALWTLAKEFVMFAASGFKVGRTLEETIDDSFTQMMNAPPQPNPEAEKLQADMAMAKEKHAMEMEKGKADVRGKQQVAELTAQAKQGDIAAKQQAAQADMAKQQADMQMARQMAHLELQIKHAELELEREKMALERERMQIERQTAAMDASVHARKTSLDIARQAAEAGGA